MTENQLPPMKIAFVIDNKVVDILHTDERLAAIMLSEPIIVNVTGENGQQIAQVEDSYDPSTGSFISAANFDHLHDDIED
jgi:hypothetical protein